MRYPNTTQRNNPWLQQYRNSYLNFNKRRESEITGLITDLEKIELQQARIREQCANFKAALTTLSADNKKSWLEIEDAEEEAEEITRQIALMAPEEKDVLRQRLNKLYPQEFLKREAVKHDSGLSDAGEREVLESSKEWELVDTSVEELRVDEVSIASEKTKEGLTDTTMD